MMKDVQGAVIALVGPDGSGKTTLATHLVEVRSRSSVALTYHLGKPNPAGATKTVRLAVRAVRKGLRSLPWPFRFPRDDGEYVRLEGLLHLMTALERWSLARHCFKKAAHGALIFTDRYPGRVLGSTNGPRIPKTGPPMVRLLGKLERQMHEAIPTPDAVIRIRVPVEETVRRNDARGAEKSESTIRTSHGPAEGMEFSSEFQVELDGMRTPEELFAEGNSFVDSVLLKLRGLDRRP